MEAGSEQIEDDELLFRRVRSEWVERSQLFDPTRALVLDSFKPSKDDHTGLSLFREKYHEANSIGGMNSRSDYFVAVVRAGDIRQKLQLTIEPKPIDGKPGHCEILQLVASTRDSVQSLQWQKQLLHELVIPPVLGPFRPTMAKA